MTDWVRLWHDMPTDPKWRVIARRSGQPLTAVISVFTMLLVEASRVADRGCVAGWRHEDAAAALDMEEADVAAIVDAMQGRVIVEHRLSGWERRQPKREDDSSDRVARYRERKKNGDASKRGVTQANAPETDTDTDSSDASASGDGAPGKPATPPDPPASVAKPIDLKAAIFAAGVPLLVAVAKPDDPDAPRKARAMIGRWRKDFTDGAVLDALAVAQAEAVSDPIPFITRTLEARNGKRTSPANDRDGHRNPMVRAGLAREARYAGEPDHGSF